MIDKWLFRQIDNSALIVFRMIFGGLIFLESAGAIATGWVKRTLIDPQFTFNFIGLEFLQPLPGPGMYLYFALMALLGLGVMAGYRYRLTMGTFTLMWAGVYLMQKASYNNHYYLLLLLCMIMTILPANRYASLDVRRNPGLKSLSMPNWCKWVIVLQVWIVYTYAAVAKIYPDWLDLTVASNLMKAREHYPVVGPILQQSWTHAAIAWTGIFFDLLVVPMLLWRRTRMFAFVVAVFFHLFNSVVFQIGIFPYLALGLTVFFFDVNRIRSLFLKNKPAFESREGEVPAYRNALLLIGGLWFAVQVALPLRHWVIPGDVLWTEEGHRLSWRMMLRGKSGQITFRVVDKETGERFGVDLGEYLTKKQRKIVATKPDVIWQFARRLKMEYGEEGKDVAVYAVRSRVSVNGRRAQPFIDPKVDLAASEWYLCKPQPWVLPFKKELD